jgi:demethylmenaquinone methyltransferase/2-methoxy-6-polyprenyl-1,4-benzoquinol methylase
MSYQTAQSQFLHQIYDVISPQYDLINRIMSLGLDQIWRRRAARECLAGNPSRVLDLCCGTGDLTLELCRISRDGTKVTGVDFSQAMLALAEQKARSSGISPKPCFVCADATSLPFPEDNFDSVAISFAFRNLSYKNPLIEQCLAEVLRVLKPDGRLVIVETSQPKSRLIKSLYHIYLRQIVRRLGIFISGNQEGYRYLAESAAGFYSPEELTDLLSRAGFTRVCFHRHLLGATGIHIVTKQKGGDTRP